MATIIYLEDTITFLANMGKVEFVKDLAKLGEFKQTKDVCNCYNDSIHFVFKRHS